MKRFKANEVYIPKEMRDKGYTWNEEKQQLNEPTPPEQPVKSAEYVDEQKMPDYYWREIVEQNTFTREDMEGFAEWCEMYYGRHHEPDGTPKAWNALYDLLNEEPYTTSQLLTEYLNSKAGKK